MSVEACPTDVEEGVKEEAEEETKKVAVHPAVHGELIHTAMRPRLETRECNTARSADTWS